MPWPIGIIHNHKSDEARILSKVEILAEEAIPAASFVSLIGCLQQLSELSTYSCELFSDIDSHVRRVEAKLKSVSSRAEKIFTGVDEVEDIMTANPQLMTTKDLVVISEDEADSDRPVSSRPASSRPLSMVQRSSKPLALQYAQQCNLADRSTLPRFLRAFYESSIMHRPPRLQDLDHYKASFKDGNKVDTFVHTFSNPEFFLKQWCYVQEQRMLAHEKDKQLRKKEKAQRGMRSAAKSIAVKARPKSTLNWQDRYMENGKAIHRVSAGTSFYSKNKYVSKHRNAAAEVLNEEPYGGRRDSTDSSHEARRSSKGSAVAAEVASASLAPKSSPPKDGGGLSSAVTTSASESVSTAAPRPGISKPTEIQTVPSFDIPVLDDLGYQLSPKNSRASMGQSDKSLIDSDDDDDFVDHTERMISSTKTIEEVDFNNPSEEEHPRRVYAYNVPTSSPQYKQQPQSLSQTELESRLPTYGNPIYFVAQKQLIPDEKIPKTLLDRFKKLVGRGSIKNAGISVPPPRSSHSKSPRSLIKSDTAIVANNSMLVAPATTAAVAGGDSVPIPAALPPVDSPSSKAHKRPMPPPLAVIPRPPPPPATPPSAVNGDTSSTPDAPNLISPLSASSAGADSVTSSPRSDVSDVIDSRPPAPTPPLGRPPPPSGNSPYYLGSPESVLATPTKPKPPVPPPPPPPPPAPLPPSQLEQKAQNRLLVSSMRLNRPPVVEPTPLQDENAFHPPPPKLPFSGGDFQSAASKLFNRADVEAPVSGEGSENSIPGSAARKGSLSGGSGPPNLLQAIRRGSHLKKVDMEEEAAKKKAAQENASPTSGGMFSGAAVTAILERRKFLENPSSDEDSDGETWD